MSLADLYMRRLKPYETCRQPTWTRRMPRLPDLHVAIAQSAQRVNGVSSRSEFRSTGVGCIPRRLACDSLLTRSLERPVERWSQWPPELTVHAWKEPSQITRTIETESNPKTMSPESRFRGAQADIIHFPVVANSDVGDHRYTPLLRNAANIAHRESAQENQSLWWRQSDVSGAWTNGDDGEIDTQHGSLGDYRDTPPFEIIHSSPAVKAFTTPHLKPNAPSQSAQPEPSNEAALSKKKKRKVRICKYKDCTKRVVDHGVCIRHGGGKRCVVDGCNCRAQQRGVCWKHGGFSICSVEGCSKRAKSRGVCWAHGGGTCCKIDGCVKIAVSLRLCWAHGGGKRCQLKDCRKPASERTNNLCNDHFAGHVLSMVPQ